MYISPKEFALMHSVNERVVRRACNERKIKGARRHRISHCWEIPADSVCPIKSREMKKVLRKLIMPTDKAAIALEALGLDVRVGVLSRNKKTLTNRGKQC